MDVVRKWISSLVFVEVVRHSRESARNRTVVLRSGGLSLVAGQNLAAEWAVRHRDNSLD